MSLLVLYFIHCIYCAIIAIVFIYVYIGIHFFPDARRSRLFFERKDGTI